MSLHQSCDHESMHVLVDHFPFCTNEFCRELRRKKLEFLDRRLSGKSKGVAIVIVACSCVWFVRAEPCFRLLCGVRGPRALLDVHYSTSWPSSAHP